jgi:NAD(P)-dependent dehydrogenase (short-subunit alcohol dehydrogenase family)
MKIDSGTVVIVTGSSSGIGRALALALARRGARLGLIARREERLNDVADGVRGLGGDPLVLPCDVTRREDFELAVERTIAHFGDLHVLVNNAGRGHFAYIEETPEEQIESIFRVNVFSLWYGTSAALRHMRVQGRGHIVNISSMAGKLGYPANAAYVAAKHATVGFTRALRSELAGTGIDATVVLPSGTLTDWATVTEGGPMIELFAYENSRGAEIARERGQELPPSMPLLSAEEVAEAIVGIIERPAPESYTHPGSRQLALEFERDQAAMEKMLEPLWLANREAYEKMKSAEL